MKKLLQIISITMLLVGCSTEETPNDEQSEILTLTNEQANQNTQEETKSPLIENTPPVAIIDDNMVVKTGEQLFIDGARSTDTDGDGLIYKWNLTNLPEGSQTKLFVENFIKASITPDFDGLYVVQLIVNDGLVDSEPVSMVIEATSENLPPIAILGDDKQVKTGEFTVITASDSYDADNDNLSYHWSIVAKPESSLLTFTDLNNTTIKSKSFLVDVDGDYIFQLIVNDGVNDSKPVFKTISASLENFVPIANAGKDRDVILGTTVILDGLLSSDDNPDDNLSYKWSLENHPLESLTGLNNHTQARSYFIPDKEGGYIISLIVNDGTVDSKKDSLTIFVKSDMPTTNNIPIADAGKDRIIKTGETTQIDASNSSDLDKDILSYEWKLISQPDSNPFSTETYSSPILNVTPDIAGDYTFQLIVHDGFVSSKKDIVTITVIPSSINGISLNDAGFPDIKGTYSIFTSIYDYTCTSGEVGTIPEFAQNTIIEQDINNIFLKKSDSENDDFLDNFTVTLETKNKGLIDKNANFTTSRQLNGEDTNFGNMQITYTTIGTFTNSTWSGTQKMSVVFLDFGNICTYEGTFTGEKF
jgi:hypothetical protein